MVTSYIAILLVVLFISTALSATPLQNLLEVKEIDTSLPNSFLNENDTGNSDDFDFLQHFIFCFDKETMKHKRVIEKYLNSQFGTQLGKGCQIIVAPTKKMSFLMTQLKNRAENRPTAFSSRGANDLLSSLLNVHVGMYKPQHKYQISRFDKAMKIMKSFKKDTVPQQKQEIQAYPQQQQLSEKKMFTNSLQNHLNIKQASQEADMPFVIVALKEKSKFNGKILSSDFDDLSFEMKLGSILRQNLLVTDEDFKIVSTVEKIFISFPNQNKATKKQLEKLLPQLARMHEIHWIEPHFFNSVKNYWTRLITQGAVNPGSSTDSVLQNFGLTGANQVVAIADSGLDHKSCFFADSDPANANFFVRTDISAAETYIALEKNKHRKIKGYWGLIDEYRSLFFSCFFVCFPYSFLPNNKKTAAMVRMELTLPVQ